MLAKLIKMSIRLRLLMLGLLFVLLLGGVYAAKSLPIDAIPDVSNIQVSVLTEAPGLSAYEVERMVTFPMENALNGLPGMSELRSVSRADISAISIVFEDGTDPWFARQLVLERVNQARGDLPEGLPPPQLAPLSNGLGEIYQFVVRSDLHTQKQLRTLLDWEIVPRIRGVPGVIEVNTMGGDLKQYQVIARPSRLHAYGLTIRELADTLRKASATVSGGYLDRQSEAFTLRAVGTFRDTSDIANAVLKMSPDGQPVLVRHVAEVRDGAALRQGVITYQGKGEAVTGVIMMLLGENSREVVYAVKDKLEQIEKELPPGVNIEPIYDRANFVERTLTTVRNNLLEGVAVVFLVLTVLLGSFRGAVVTVLGIPVAMTIAVFGMHLTGITGDLMSLGAIDFGFLVDGPIVILEALLATYLGSTLAPKAGVRAAPYARTMGKVVRPVAYSVAIIMLVYLPLLGLEGVEGRMFKPMAITMAFALFGALVYSVLFLPALLVLFVPPLKRDGAAWLSRIAKYYRRAVAGALRVRWLLLMTASAALVMAIIEFGNAGANFVPRIDEGDAVVTIRRSPSINLPEAKKLDLAAARILREFPETESTLAMTGRAEVAIDPVGMDNTDIFVHLAPKSKWETADDLDGLSEAFKTAIESRVPGTFVSVSQPIEDRTNEMISGSRADVQIMVFGSDLLELKRMSEEIADLVKPIDGTGDVRVERVLGLPELTVTPNRMRLARYGVRMEDALDAIEAARVGSPLGWVFEGQRRFEVRLHVPPRAPVPEALGDLYVETVDGDSVRLSEVADVVESEGPAQIRRLNRLRTVRVEVNLRGRDLVSWVSEARERVREKLPLPSGYRIEWGGQFENFERAAERLMVVVPAALLVIFVMLQAIFRDVRYATAVFMVVPFALVGGIAGLILRGLTFSIPAAVGFIALAGVAVLNGVVLASEVRNAIRPGVTFDQAVINGSVHTMRAVLTTGAVAALGFLPMATATGAGAEVQRPLATVVVFGIGASTLMTMFLLPAILKFVLRSEQRKKIRLPAFPTDDT